MLSVGEFPLDNDQVSIGKDSWTGGQASEADTSLDSVVLAGRLALATVNSRHGDVSCCRRRATAVCLGVAAARRQRPGVRQSWIGADV